LKKQGLRLSRGPQLSYIEKEGERERARGSFQLGWPLAERGEGREDGPRWGEGLGSSRGKKGEGDLGPQLLSHQGETERGEEEESAFGPKQREGGVLSFLLFYFLFVSFYFKAISKTNLKIILKSV